MRNFLTFPLEKYGPIHEDTQECTVSADAAWRSYMLDKALS